MARTVGAVRCGIHVTRKRLELHDTTTIAQHCLVDSMSGRKCLQSARHDPARVYACSWSGSR
eukprot:15449300-Alexandrium_andersonii.AAC.1